MKLLGWMHRKFRQNSGEAFTIGNSCNCLTGQPSLEEQQHNYHTKPHYPFRPSTDFHKQNLFPKSFQEEVPDFEDGPTFELFHSLLTIGTLGSDSVLAESEPGTPTFASSFENVAEKDTDETENDLKLINDELEKVLGADAKDDSCGRTSHVSVITLSGNENGLGVCPLQGYLFGSPVGLPETTASNVRKKEHRTSLGDLFQKSRLAEEKSEVKRESDKSVKKSIKRMLRSSTAATSDSASADNKLNKLLQMFHRKVHPDNTTTNTKKDTKHLKSGSKNNTLDDAGGHDYGDRTLPDEDIIMIPKRSISKMRQHKSQSNPPPGAIGGSESNGNRECWIKTDADYLVLELYKQKNCHGMARAQLPHAV